MERGLCLKRQAYQAIKMLALLTKMYSLYNENHQSLIKGQNSLWLSSATHKEVYNATEQQNHASEEAASQRILI